MARTLWLTCVVLACVAGPAGAQTLEFTTATYPSASGARGAVGVDLNRDGWLDVATANAGRNTVALLLNRGKAGGFEPPREIPVGAGPFDIVAGDLNRDGIEDLVVTTPDARAIDVLLMSADAQVASRHTLAIGGDSRGAALADVTRDGVLDLVYSDYGRSMVVVLPGTGTGAFFSDIGDIPVGAHPQGVAAADFNHDGFVDIAVASTGAAVLDVLYGNAAGDFTRRSFAAGRPLNVLIAVDMDADGWLDIAAAATSTNVVAIFRAGASGFTLAGTRATGSSPRGIGSGDFNQDGRPDLAVANYAGNSVTLLLGRDGSVLPARWGELPSGSGARAVVSGDFDNDGRADIAAGPQSASQLWVHTNNTAFVRPALSFRRQRTGGYLTGVAHADFNENGRVDLLFEHTVLLDGATSVSLPVDPRASITALATTDYNGDGHADALLGKSIYDAGLGQYVESLDIYVGNGRGQFAAPTTLVGPPTSARFVRTGDLDRDGRVDIVTLGTRELYVNQQTGSGLRQTIVPLPAIGFSFQLADMNRDGILDAVVAHANPYTLNVYPGDGAGGFLSASVAASNATDAFELGDLNHDARLDIVFPYGTQVAVVLATESGWAAPAFFPGDHLFDSSSAPILGDFDNDGNLDVFTWSGSLLAGNGDGTLEPPAPFAVDVPGGFAFDWNRDGLLDVVSAAEAIVNERRAENRPPVANAGADRTFLYHEQFEQDDGSLSGVESFDPDLHRLSYEWRDETGTIFGYSSWASFPAKDPGTYTFTLTVRDGRGGEATDSIQVTIANEPEIVLHPGADSTRVGTWTVVDDTTAASSRRLFYPNANATKVETPLAAPPSYVDVWFAADPSLTYKLWLRLKAQNNSFANDSVWLQFTGATDLTGQPVYRIGTGSGLAVNLEECSGCGVSGWGWEDDGWGAPNRNGVLLRFPDGGGQRIRIQVREDGVSVDQIVLSAATFKTARPGRAKNDTVILAATQREPQ